MSPSFSAKVERLAQQQEALLYRSNSIDKSWTNGIFRRYRYPVLTREHTPLMWRYCFDERRNPFLMERLGVNSVFNPGAILLNGSVHLVCRIEGVDRKSFFAVAESRTGVDGFRFWRHPLEIPPADELETNLYDMRLVQHEDGWIYGVFCAESRDSSGCNVESAVARCGIARTRDLKQWQRLPNLVTESAQQRNSVLHPELVRGQYFFYTRPQDSFCELGNHCGIGGGYVRRMSAPVVTDERPVESIEYHTIKEFKNGAGPPPVWTPAGWLHIAHGVRHTASGLRYVLYAFLCSLEDPSCVTHRPGGYLMAPRDSERVGDVSNVLFCNGAVVRGDGTLLIYYASSDTRIHVASTTVERMVDYVVNTPEDGQSTHGSAAQRNTLIQSNAALTDSSGYPLLRRIASHTLLR